MPIDVGKCPIPFPNLSNNQHCMMTGQVSEEMKRMRCDPFVRLMSIPTKSFAVKKCDNPCAPQDALDRALSACYDHHRQWWAPKAQTVMQCSTYALFPWGRAQRKLCRLQCLPDDPCFDACLAATQEQYAVNHEPYRNDVNHLDISIASPHISNTNRGFGRSIDGSFYNC